MPGLGDLFLALGTGDLSEQEAYDTRSLKVAQAGLTQSRMEEALAKASIEREKAAAISRLRDRNNYQDRNSQGSIAFNPVRYRDDATLAFANSANDFATAGNTFQRGDVYDEATNALRAGDTSLGNRMLIAYKGDPITASDVVSGTTTFDPFNASAPIGQTLEGQANVRKTDAQVDVANAQVDRLGADMARIRAQSDLIRAKTGQVGKTPPPRAGAMSPTLQKELIEADDTFQASNNVVTLLENAKKLNNKAYSGIAAGERAWLSSQLPDVVADVFPGESDSADATINLDNMMTGQALESLKSTFGAAPTEGERKILMEMQASVGKTPSQRRAIMDRAIAAAKRRSQYSAQKARSIRDGTYLSESPSTYADPDTALMGFDDDPGGSVSERKVMGGIPYVKIDGEWYEE